MSTLAAPQVAPLSVPVVAVVVAVRGPRAVRPPRTVTLADRVARAFPPLACVRGFRYFASGRVEVVTITDDAVDAAVKGKRLQQVRLRIEDGRVATGCTCCAKLMGPAACKHVWAALLEVDRRGAFASLRTTARVLLLGVLDAAKAKATKPKTTTTKAPAKAASKVAAKPKATAAKRARVRGAA